MMHSLVGQVVGGLFNALLEPRPFQGIPSECPQQLPAQAGDPLGGAGGADHLLSKLRLHVPRIDVLDGDWYIHCSCGWYSLPCVEIPDLRCEVEDAEARGWINRQRFLSRQQRLHSVPFGYTR